jgi:hypothetical protein
MKIDNTTGLLIAGGLVFIGMCLPWTVIRMHGHSMSLSGWQGTANLNGLQLPGILVPAAAAIAIVGTIGQAKKQWKCGLPRVLPMSLCLYGFVHTGFMGLALAKTPDMYVGVGVFVTLLGLAATFASTWNVYVRPVNSVSLNNSASENCG